MTHNYTESVKCLCLECKLYISSSSSRVCATRTSRLTTALLIVSAAAVVALICEVLGSSGLADYNPAASSPALIRRNRCNVECFFPFGTLPKKKEKQLETDALCGKEKDVWWSSGFSLWACRAQTLARQDLEITRHRCEIWQTKVISLFIAVQLLRIGIRPTDSRCCK